MNKILDAFIGGWEITGTFRDTSAFPFAVSDGSRWATNWKSSSGATPAGCPSRLATSSRVWCPPTPA